MVTTIDDLLTGGAAGKTAKFDKPGTTHGGVVVSAEARQATDLTTQKPDTWDNGDPKMQAVIGFQTGERNPEIENDDGVRFIYVKLWGEQKKAFRAAAQQAGGSPAPGDFFQATYFGDGEQKTRGFNAPKLYKYDIKKSSALDAAIGTTSAPAQTGFAAGPTDAQKAQIKQLIGLAVPDDKIVGVVDGVTVEQVAVFRAQLAADSSAGF